MEKQNVKIIRRLISFLLVILFVFIIVRLTPLFMQLVTEEGRIAFSYQIKQLGVLGVIEILLLEICKIVVVFLPGEPIELLAGMSFGPVWGTAIIYAGVILTTTLIYKAVKKYGRILVEDVVPKERLQKVESKIRENPDKFENTLFVLYFLPVVPKDFLTYIGSLLPITFRRFLSITLIARFPAIISSTVVGASIVERDLKTIILAYGITYIISLTIAYAYNKKSKKKIDQKERA